MNTLKEDRSTGPNLLLLLASGLCLCFYFWQVWGFYHDDSYIVLRYVDNFLRGNGLVFNHGERVEGYSNFSWLMLISLVGYFNTDLVLVSKALGIFFVFATLMLFFIFEKQQKIIGALLLSTNSCFALWAVGGMETVTFGFFIFLECYLFLKINRTKRVLFLIGLLFSLMAMTRPEGMLIFFITLLFCLFENKKLTETNLKNCTIIILGFLLLYFPYFIGRFYYYGHLFPCPVYVKGGTNVFKLVFGSRYVFDFLLTYGFPLLILLFIKERKKFILDNAYLASILLGCSCYIVLVGGDHMQGFRFYIPLLPLFYLFIQEAFFEVQCINRTMVYNACAFIFIILNFFVSYNTIPQSPEANREAILHSYKYKYCFKSPDPAAYVGKYVGTYIKEHWSSAAVVASNCAGSLPYFSEIPTAIDMLGLNDYRIAQRDTSAEYNYSFWKLMDIKKLFTRQGRSDVVQDVTKKYLPWQLIPGHGKGDGIYVLSMKPDYIIIGPPEGDIKPWFLGDREIMNSPDFHENYQLRQVSIKTEDIFQEFYPSTQNGSLTFRYYERKKQK